MGVALALTIVALALILNSTIYTENLAARDNDVPATDAIEYRESAREGVAGSIAHVNRHARSETKPNHTAALNDSIVSWSESTAKFAAVDGRTVNVTLNRSSVVWRTRIGQNAGRDFTSTSGEGVWTLANETGNITSFRMNINRSGLDDTNRFGIRFTNSSGRQDVLINNSSDPSEIIVEGPSGSTCSVESQRAELDIVAGTILNGTNRTNGTNETAKNCPALDFFDSSGNYNVTYGNAAKISGVYELSVEKDRDDLLFDPGDYDGEPDPYASWAIHNATATVSYQSPSLRYDTNATVEPHEPETLRPTEAG
ncbi:hypothetical protein BRC86_07340 [Halobacteriales archaeon QS_3_64_16]|nr:MAG: hypothetical protein BRC86_07340 [Halobacteriales archaeon QS_3_64_16]